MMRSLLRFKRRLDARGDEGITLVFLRHEAGGQQLEQMPDAPQEHAQQRERDDSHPETQAETSERPSLNRHRLVSGDECTELVEQRAVAVGHAREAGEGVCGPGGVSAEGEGVDEAEGGATENSPLSRSAVLKFKVAELRSQCKARGLSMLGNKDTLQSRLTAHCTEE